jgi:hypothetical protein
MKRAKRGSFTEALQWVFRLLAASLLLMLLLSQISMLTGYAKDTDALELQLYRERLLGPEGIFVTEHGRVLPGIVDPTKMTDQHLFSAYRQEEPVFAARLTLYEDAALSKVLFEAAHSDELLDPYLELGKAGLTGSGGARYEALVLPVLVDFPTGKTTRLATSGGD